MGPDEGEEGAGDALVRARLTRRALLGAGIAGAGGALLAACGGSAAAPRRVPRAVPLGVPPNRRAPVGSDQLPQVDHIVVVMLENHSYDNILGTLGRGDGLPRGADGAPDATNPDGAGELVRSFHMPTPCQLHGKPSQTWNASHEQYDGGRLQGFVESASGPVAMGYWTGADLPFTHSLASTFPVADRYFCSVLAQTYPNRRYLISGTSFGLVADVLSDGLPPGGTIFDLLSAHDISWKNYYSSLPTAGVYVSLLARPSITSNLAHVDHFFADCASGSLPAFSIVDPNFGTQSEEDPQDVQYGDVFLASVVRAVMAGPKWSTTLLVWSYDEHGGYYDHVPPPRAAVPDAVPPDLAPGDVPGRFDRYGFRVPAGVVSPYARAGYVSRVVHDHTSVLKLIETKWNLPPLTHRDAAADDLLDLVDFDGSPAFLRPPALAQPANPAVRSGCEATGPGVIPPASAVIRSR
jgi:phospholipase C